MLISYVGVNIGEKYWLLWLKLWLGSLFYFQCHAPDHIMFKYIFYRVTLLFVFLDFAMKPVCMFFDWRNENGHWILPITEHICYRLIHILSYSSSHLFNSSCKINFYKNISGTRCGSVAILATFTSQSVTGKTQIVPCFGRDLARPELRPVEV